MSLTSFIQEKVTHGQGSTVPHKQWNTLSEGLWARASFVGG